MDGMRERKDKFDSLILAQGIVWMVDQFQRWKSLEERQEVGDKDEGLNYKRIFNMLHTIHDHNQ